MLNADEFIGGWEKLETAEELQAFIVENTASLTDEIVQRMKDRANQLCDSDMQRAVRLAESILYAANSSQQPLHRAWAYMAAGNAARWQGRFREATELYQTAHSAAISAGNELEAARSQIGNIHALTMQGEYQRAIQIGTETLSTLQKYNQLFAVANLTLSMGVCYRAIGRFDDAIKIMQAGLESCNRLNSADSQMLYPILTFNISVVLADQNQYQEALLKATEAADIQLKLGNRVAYAIYQEAVGYYNLQLGQFNKALRLLDEARQVFVANNMRDYILFCDLYTVQAYLALNRTDEVVERCQEVIDYLKEQQCENTYEAGRVFHYQGIALASQGLHAQALESFAQARNIFSSIGTEVIAANPTLDQAELHYRRNEYEQVEMLCQQLGQTFNQHQMQANQARCDVLLGRVRLAQGELTEACRLAESAKIAGESAHTPLLVYQALLLQAEIAEAEGNFDLALERYQNSLNTVEEMRGRVAVEARAAFIEDKESAYQGAVALSLELGQHRQALELVESGKSRSLQDLLAGELDVRVRVHSEEDRPLIEQLEKWRATRNELVSLLANWTRPLALNTRSNASLLEAPLLEDENDRAALQERVKEAEKQIALLVERLQVRNAAYAEDAILQTPRATLSLDCLEEGTVLLEYYVCRGEILVFILDRNRTEVVRNIARVESAEDSLSFLRLNLNIITRLLMESLSPEEQAARIRSANSNARGLLKKLHRQLLAPLSAYLQGYRKLIIVPHGPLHYLPFHALYNGETNRYLLQEWEEISYLPSSSLLDFCQRRAERIQTNQGSSALVMGYSSNGQLLHCPSEASSIAGRLQTNGLECQLLLEDEARMAHFENLATEKRLIHLATHGQFRQDNPLFSSLSLADGALTAQDLFNSELHASLVTFSACETGLGVLGGGDEVLGLSRACLYAGASSLLLSLWRVEDESVAMLMEDFYSRLLSGTRKASALIQAQRALLEIEQYQHPFFWAPFFLVGHPGQF